MRRSTAVPKATLSLLAAFALAGCMIGGGNQTPSLDATSAPAASAPAATAPATQTASPAPSPDAVLASRKTSYADRSARIDLNQVVVSDGVTTVTWTISNLEVDNDLGLAAGLGKNESIFGDGRSATVPGSDTTVSGDLAASDGVFIIDTLNKRRYLAARDAGGVCLCSTVERFEQLGVGESKPFSATYRAIPDGVATVNISIPGAGTFVKVPVQR